MPPGELKDYADDELYDKLDNLKVKKARLGRHRDQYTNHTRACFDAEIAQVKAELRRRRLKIKRPDDKRVLPTAAHIAVEKAAA